MARHLDDTQVVHPTHFGHAVLRTRNLDEAIAWYGTVVGMRVVHRNPFIAFLTYDDEHHRLALVQTGEQAPAPPGAAGLDHLGYTLASLGDLLGTYRRLAAKGILPVWAINHGLTTSLYYADPDGIRVEFQVENFATKAELEGFMRSDAFAKNPIGIEFDPEKLAARYERGDPLPELLRQGATG
jgi:catechol-2,3-dioxygenase